MPEVFNIRPGKAISINALLRMPMESSGQKDIQATYQTAPTSEARYSFAAIGKAESRFEFRTQVSLYERLRLTLLERSVYAE